MNLLHIIEAYRNDKFPPEKLKLLIQEVSDSRMSICNSCPEDSICAGKGGYHRCLVCKCPLPRKTKSLSTRCPLGKWEAVTDDATRYEIEKSIKNHEENQSGD